MKGARIGCLVVVVIVGAVLLANSLFAVDERQQVIVTQFGDPVGDPVTRAGLNFKVPFIQKVNMVDKRILEWDGRAHEMPTRDKLYISVDTFGRWRIQDPLTFFVRLSDERRAQSRIEDILGSETRNAVAKHELIEIIRTTEGRQPLVDESLTEGNSSVGVLRPIRKGRAKIEREIFHAAAGKLAEFGIELLDVRFKRINYNQDVRVKIYERMISERQQIAERFRSEGAGEAARILGDKERDLREIESVAYREVQEIRGDADAEATKIYASAYNRSPDAVDLYEFIKSMDTYRVILDERSTLILTTDSDLFQFLKDMEGGE